MQQEQLVNTWLSATDRPNVLVVGPVDAIYVKTAMALRTADPPCEVVCLDQFSDAMRLLRRGSIALIVMAESPLTEGGLELIIEGLGKSRPPRYVIATNGAPKAGTDKSPLVRQSANAPASLRDAMLMAVAEYERGLTGNLSVRALLEASAGFPEQLWLKVCNEDGEFTDLCLNAGRIVYAECGKLSGPAAVEKVLSWNNCLYESRELPAFLQSNMSCWLRELARLHQPEVAQPAVTTPAPAPVVEEPEFEEPTDFAPIAASLEPPPEAPVIAESLTEEPSEPSFEFPALDELAIEEPLEFRIDEMEGGSVHEGEPEEPESFEFDGAMTQAFELPAEQLFAATAVIAEGSSHLENCQPESEAVFFDTLAMRDIFDLSIRCGQRQQIGSPKWVQVASDGGTIVIAPIPGSRRLVAVRLRDRFGDVEQAELVRLQQSLEHNCSLV